MVGGLCGVVKKLTSWGWPVANKGHAVWGKIENEKWNVRGFITRGTQSVWKNAKLFPFFHSFLSLFFCVTSSSLSLLQLCFSLGTWKHPKRNSIDPSHITLRLTLLVPIHIIAWDQMDKRCVLGFLSLCLSAEKVQESDKKFWGITIYRDDTWISFFRYSPLMERVWDFF